MERVRLPPLPPELTSEKPDPTTKIVQKPDGSVTIHSVRQGVESHLDYRSDGSYKVHSNTGSIIEFAANNHLFYQKGGFTLTVDNNGDIKMAGHGRINIDHDAHIEVAKNASIAVNGMSEIYSTGHVKVAAADIYIGATKGSIVLNAARDIEMTASKGRFTLNTSGVQTFTTSSGDFHVATAGQIDMNSQLDTQITSQGKITSVASQDNTIKSKAAVVTLSNSGTKLEGGGPSSPPLTISPGGGVS